MKNEFKKFCVDAIKTKSISWIKKGHREKYDLLYKLTSFCNKKIGTKDRLYCIIHNITHIDLCISCNKINVNVNFKDNIQSKYCSKCIMSSDEIKEKRKATNIKLYGVDNTYKSEEKKEKSRQTCLKNHGVEYSLQSKEIREKSKQTMLEKYGVEHALQNEEFKQKCKQTSLENWGVDNPAKNSKIKEKMEKTCLEKYEVTHWVKTEECRKLLKINKKINKPALNLLENKEWLIEKYKNNTIKELMYLTSLSAKTILNYLHFHNIPIKPSSNFSEISINWLNYISEENNIYIQHAMNVGEYRIPNTRYIVDGYCKENNTIYEFLGDCWHGNLDVYNSNDKPHPFSDKTAKELNQEWLNRKQIIKDLGYNVVYIWENSYKSII